MKKFFIPLVFIFGFLVCIPQSVFADLIRPMMSNKKIQEIEKQRKEIEKQRKKTEKDLICVNKIKEKLSQKYSGKDIKLKSCDKFNNATKNSHRVPNYTGNAYHIYGEGLSPVCVVIKKGENMESTSCYDAYFVSGHHKNCHEYIALKPTKSFVRYCADVTKVPKNSYLQYIPENETLKVISPGDDNYADVVKKWDQEYYNLTFGYRDIKITKKEK